MICLISDQLHKKPLLTIIDKDKDFDKLYEKVELSSQTVNKLANKSQ